MTYDTTQYRVFLTATDRSGDRDPLTQKLRSFARLQNGWSYGRGRNISQPVIDKAEKLLEFGTQLHLKAEVFPGTDGDVVVGFHAGDDCVQVTVNHDLSLGLRIERGHGADYEDVIAPIERVQDEALVYSSIVGLTRDDDAWKLLESSISSTLVEYSDASSILPSRIRAA